MPLKDISFDMIQQKIERFDIEVSLDVIQQKIERFDIETSSDESGYVIESADGIARIQGLPNVENGEMVEFPNNIFGLVFNLEKNEVICAILERHTAVREGSWVKRSKRVMDIGVGECLLGRVIDSIGNPIDELGELEFSAHYPIERTAPGVVDRQPVRMPLQTGYKIIDSLVPIGRGQRELIIGDRQTGKTTLATDTILAQKNSDVISVYVAIGQKQATVVKLVAELARHGALKNTVIVNAPASSPAITQYLAPYTGCAIAEYFMYEKNRDTLIIYDDLSKHAAAYRHISLLMRRPPGREAYPGDVFYLHSRLLERAGKLSDELGGGSMTALPIIETQGNDISAYIPTNVISITDGQIFLEADLFNAGIRPAVNAGISVSRVGGSAQKKAMRQVSGTLRIDLAQFREKEAFSMFSSDLDDETKVQLAKGRLMVEILKQDKARPMNLADQVLILYAGTRSLIMDVPLERIAEFEDGLLYAFNREYSSIREEIIAKGALDEDLEKKLSICIGEYKKEFLNVKTPRY
jgi:F-type H+-transporting ATPase subunit alpha